jgi:hypothetical protein
MSGCRTAASPGAEGTVYADGGLRRLEVFRLVAGEEARSRKAGENAEVPARHLVTL